MAMTKDEMAMIAMEIVAYAGDARTKFLAAMDADGGVAWCIVESESDRTSVRTVREGLAYLRAVML